MQTVNNLGTEGENWRHAMRAERAGKYSRAGEKVKLAIMDDDEQTRRVHEAVARRAYVIFESHGSASGHELEDWRQAESEVVGPLCCGRMTIDDSLWVGADVAIFEEGTIEVWVGPRQITICGKPKVDKVGVARKETGARLDGEMVFRFLDLPVEVDPSRVTTRFNGPSLEVLLRKTQARSAQETRAAA